MTKEKKSIVIKKPDFTNIKFEDIKVSVVAFVKKYSNIFVVLGYILIILASFAIVDMLVQYLRNDASIAIVNGEKISMDTYYKRLEQVNGMDTTSNLIDETVIRQAAAEKNFTVSSEEIDKYLNQYVEYFGTQAKFEEVLAERKTSVDDIKYTIETDLLGKQVVTSDIEVDDATLKSFYEQYAEQIFPNEITTDPADETKKILPDFTEKKAEILDVYLNQQYSQNKDSWLATKKAALNIQNNYSAKPDYKIFSATVEVVKKISDSISNAVAK